MEVIEQALCGIGAIICFGLAATITLTYLFNASTERMLNKFNIPG